MSNRLSHRAFSAEAIDARITLTQTDDPARPSVVLHREQLRAVCEHFGLQGASNEAQTIEVMRRRHWVLQDLIATLHDYMCKHGDFDHADLDFEMARLQALRALADAWGEEYDLPAFGTALIEQKGCTT